MRLLDVLERLQGLHEELSNANELDANPEVRIAYQPSYPLYADTAEEYIVHHDGAVYIAQDPSGPNGYLDGEACEKLEGYRS